MAKEMMQPAMESERELGWELRKFQILYEMAISMSAGQTLDMTLQLIVNKTREILQTDTAFIFLCDNQRKELYAHSFCGVLTGSMNNMRFAYNKSLGGESIASGKVAALENYFSCPDIEPEIKELVAKEGLVSMMAVPISINSQELGVLYVANRYVKAFDREEIDTFILIANLAAVEIQRRKAEESLRHSQRHLADIINFLPDPTLVINDEGVVISWNKAMEEMTGVPASDMLGKGDYEYAIPFYGEKRPILADLMLESDDEIQKTYSIVHRDGNTLVAETSLPCVHGIPKVLWGKATLLYDTQGRKIGAIESIRDITAKKKAEEDLREARDYLENLINSTNMPILVWDAHFYISRVNRAMENLVGYNAEYLIKQQVEILWPRNVKDEWVKQASRLGDGYKWESVELPIQRADGKLRTVLWNSATLFGKDGITPVATILQGQDITERIKAQKKVQQNLESMRRVFNGIVNALAAMAEKKDPYTAGHQRRVAELACAIARKLNMPDNIIENIRVASILHDIGKFHIPSDILTKPGLLNEIEMLLVRLHPRAGYEIVSTIPFDGPIGQILLQHHERMDGSGYPDGLSGAKILLEARIVAVADVVEAMASHRPYRPALGIEKALEEINRGKGTLYDDDVVSACTSILTSGKFGFG